MVGRARPVPRGDEHVGPTVVVEVGHLDVGGLGGEVGDAGVLRHLVEDELAVLAVVEEHPDRHLLALVDRAVEVVADHDVDAAVTIEVAHRDPR